jgi:hypothetical protein
MWIRLGYGHYRVRRVDRDPAGFSEVIHRKTTDSAATQHPDIIDFLCPLQRIY